MFIYCIEAHYFLYRMPTATKFIELHYFLYWMPPAIKFNVDCLYSKRLHIVISVMGFVTVLCNQFQEMINLLNL